MSPIPSIDTFPLEDDFWAAVFEKLSEHRFALSSLSEKFDFIFSECFFFKMQHRFFKKFAYQFQELSFVSPVAYWARMVLLYDRSR